jgi:hypothetical protein
MLDEADKNWIVDKIGSLIGRRDHWERLDRIEAGLETLVAALPTMPNQLPCSARKSIGSLKL